MPLRPRRTVSRPEVSVLLPVRNGERTLEEAIESTLSQRGPSLELIAVDDGSTDRTSAVLARWARRDGRIVRLQGAGRGIVDALRRAAQAAYAPLLARMDADDVCLPGRLSRQCALLDEHPDVGVVGTQVHAFPEQAVGEGLQRYVDWQNGLVTMDDHDRDLLVESPLCHPSTVMRREAFEGVGGYREGPFPEDYDLWLRIRAAGWRLAKIPRPLLRWRHRTGRMTFADPRFSLENFRELKARHLAGELRRSARPVVIWGAGPTGKRLARALEPHGISPVRFVDIDPRKMGRTARGAPITGPDTLVRGEAFVVVSVGARGARQLIRKHLTGRGFVELEDYICTA